MTPKDKAKEICNKFSWEKTENGYKMFQTVDETKRCALIAVNVLINYSLPASEYGGVITDNTIEYWDEVKQEIEKL
jgi:hypothetical protein